MEGEATENTKIPEEFIENPKKGKSKSKVEDDEYTSELRDEVLKLAERKEVKYTVAKMKKASKSELERILVKYEKDRAEEVINYFSDTIIGRFSDLMDHMDFCNGEDLEKDALFQRDLKSIISQSIPYIPMVGLVCGGIIVAKHWFMGKKGKGVVDTPHPNYRVK